MDFASWLTSELEIRGWKQADLARAADVPRGSINNLLTNMRKPGPELCTAIAEALTYPPEIVFRKAGLLPEEIEVSEAFLELKHRFEMAPENVKTEILDFARFKTRNL